VVAVRDEDKKEQKYHKTRWESEAIVETKERTERDRGRIVQTT
jgi:hypothetical protein